ncbi:uncharacterized protein LOC123011902 [Tribolium madens]|uniref:uncharacterized protein LOC123011902 n=1 Tax=Tribolium madens TaxID=41895 RepID=UPI001CF745C5|nr:uncharacterized protein LOC123011902 [Tribolium madens]
MTLKTESKKTKRKARPFLVLPLLENLSLKKLNMPKKTNLKLFTKTWPPKKDGKKEERPLTATLDKPTVLNISLIGIIDMSTVRKEFLNISNLCRFPIALTITKRKKIAVINRPLSLPSPEKQKGCKKRPETSEDSYEEEESISIQSAKIKPGKINTAVKKPSVLSKKKPLSDANNNTKTFKIPRKRAGTVAKLLEVNKSNLSKSTKLPEPCKTCGRPDQPERFHSHPATPLKIVKKEEPPKMKSTVQKPVAMKYKSKQSAEKKPLPPPQRKPSLPAQKLVHSPPNVGVSPETSTPRVKSAKRTLTCYICGREFGTASLPLHEPKCLQKWERENASLPTHMQRKPPVKPDPTLTPEEWNQYAWEASQATLTPCPKCGRTFYPDRLIVHQRSCKIVQDNSKSSVDKSIPPSSPMGPPSVECYICGKMFGTHSIKIHEKQCLKKWHVENDSLPADIRAPEPKKGEVGKVEHQSPEPSSRRSSVEKEEKPSSGKKSPMFPCYICGRLFTVNSIYIHEPQCLKMWKIENDKLPTHKRRPQPLKPDIKFTQDGKIDYEATNESKWQSHLSQLVPCQFCSRTFNPDRVEVHERSCKG